MSQQDALYSRARPKTLSQLIGQEHIVNALTQAISKDKLSHAYLLVGTRGTGKTSTARLLAKAMNCETVREAQQSGRPLDKKEIPCNKCEACKNFSSSPDNSEFDAASNRSVEDMNRLLSSAYFAPLVSHKKTYIIDEVHMLSTEAINSILKVIEEPPPHVAFLLATTELNKVPMTIRSRCQVLNFRLIPTDTAWPYLRGIAKLLGTNLHEDAAKKIARLAAGSMRDALTYLDQCNSGVNEEISLDDVDNMLGLVSDEKLDRVISAVRAHDRKETAAAITGAFSSGLAANTIAESLITRLRDMEFARLEKGTEIFSELDNFIDALRKSISEMYGSGIPDIILEMTLLKLAAPLQTFAPIQSAQIQMPSQAGQNPAPVANLDAGKKIFYDVANKFGRQNDGLDGIVDKALVINFSGNAITIGFKSPTLASMFEKNFLKKFEQTFAEETGRPIKISVIVDKNLSSPILDRVDEPERSALAGAMNFFGASDAKKIRE
ncbi:MAG: DNA polymerase III subunit gamma/tau [Selenomonadaceae bacterium]|nr:DNA polymerase III subunit gamma/tau [Selenomonadaceae bacterium]